VASVNGGTPGDISRNQDLDGSGLGHVLSSFATFTADATFQDIEFAGANNAGSNVANGASINLGAAYDETENDQDLQIFYRALQPGGSLGGDFDNDGDVDGADFLVWQRGGSPNPLGASDLAAWKANFGATASVVATVVQGSVSYSSAASAVPEPSSCLILLAGLPLTWSIKRRRVSRLTRLSSRAPKSIFAGSMLAVLFTASYASAAFTLDRNYRLGDGDNDSGTPTAGAQVGSTTSTGDTFDNAGTPGTGTLHDLTPHGGPVYASVTGRSLAAGSTLGVRFDGVDDFLTGFRLGLPSTSAAATGSTQIGLDGVTPVVGTLDYAGIVNRGFQFWVNPTDAAIGGGTRAVVLDGNQHGVLISAAGTWVMRYAGTDFDTGVPIKLDAVNGGWSHVMLVRPFGAAGGARMYVDGNGIGAAAGGYNGADATYLTLGASTGNLSDLDPGNDPGMGNFFAGVIDDLKMFVLGTSTNGVQYGQFDFATDNEVAAAGLAGVNPADVNRSGAVDAADVNVLLANWRSSNTFNGIVVGGLSLRDQGDLNLDGVVDLRDAVILHNGLLAAGAGTGLDFSLLGVPEPASCWLFAVALAAAALSWRCHAKRLGTVGGCV
jgi:hypothetical protein